MAASISGERIILRLALRTVRSAASISNRSESQQRDHRIAFLSRVTHLAPRATTWASITLSRVIQVRDCRKNLSGPTTQDRSHIASRLDDWILNSQA